MPFDVIASALPFELEAIGAAPVILDAALDLNSKVAISPIEPPVAILICKPKKPFCRRRRITEQWRFDFPPGTGRKKDPANEILFTPVRELVPGHRKRYIGIRTLTTLLELVQELLYAETCSGNLRFRCFRAIFCVFVFVGKPLLTINGFRQIFLESVDLCLSGSQLFSVGRPLLLQPAALKVKGAFADGGKRRYIMPQSKLLETLTGSYPAHQSAHPSGIGRSGNSVRQKQFVSAVGIGVLREAGQI